MLKGNHTPLQCYREFILYSVIPWIKIGYVVKGDNSLPRFALY